MTLPAALAFAALPLLSLAGIIIATWGLLDDRRWSWRLPPWR